MESTEGESRLPLHFGRVQGAKSRASTLEKMRGKSVRDGDRQVLHGLQKWILAVAATVLLSREQAVAFKPWAPGHHAITEDSLCGFQTDICNQALLPDDCSQGITRTIDDILLKFSDRGRHTIISANKKVDSLLPGGAFFGVAEHFDDEHFRTGDGRGPGEGATDRLIRLKEDVISELTSPSPAAFAARQRLGEALHTLQDFYAHSNWVETAHSFINADLGTRAFDPLPMSTATCNADGGDDPPVLVGVTTGYFPFTAGVPSCNFPPGKCRHGVEVLCPEGLNKDAPSRPRYCAARELAVEATTNYVNLILDAPGVAGDRKAITTLMGGRTFAVLLDNSCPMGTSGYLPNPYTMLDGLKAGIAAAVMSLQGTDDQPTEYLLASFNDSSWGPPFTTSDVTEFLQAVSAVGAVQCGSTPSGCLYPNRMRDHSQGALMETVPKLVDGDRVYLLVYGVPPESELGVASLVSHTASELHVLIEPVLLHAYDYEGSTCPGVIPFRTAYNDPAYESNAEVTGGRRHEIYEYQDYQTFVQQVVAALTDRALPTPQQSSRPATVQAPSSEAEVFLLRVSGTLSSPPQDFFVPIDPSIGRVSFGASLVGASLESVTVTVFRPSGAQVTPSDPGVTIGSGFVAVDGPEPGQWHLQVSGSGSFSASIEGRSPIDFIAFDFVALGGRPEHEGLFPIPGQPVTGTAPLGMATLVGRYATATFELVTESGASIGPLSLSGSDPNASAHEFVGTVAIPSTPFRVAAFGTDMAGFAYRRIFPARFRGQSVRVEEVSGVGDFPAGATSTLNFKVTNFGAPVTFNLVVADDAGFVSAVQPDSLTLSTGASGVAQVGVTVPPVTRAGRLVSISASATSTSDASVQNTVTVFHAVSGCGAWSQARVTLNRTILTPKLKIKGRFTLPPGTTFADFDPATTPLRVIVDDRNGEFKVDTTIPPGLFNGVKGWASSGSQWKYKDVSDDPSATNGFYRVSVRDLSDVSPGLVQVVARGQGGNYPIDVGDTPLGVTVLLNEAGACARHVFPSVACSGSVGQRVRCR